MHDEARNGRPSLLNDDLVRISTKECMTTDVSQFLICPCTFLRFQGLYSMTLSVVIWVTGKWQVAAFYEEGIQELAPRYDKCLNNGGEYVEK